MAEQKVNDFSNKTITRHQTVDGDHGRIETRDITVIHDIGWLQERHNWPAMAGVVMVESTRIIPGPNPGADRVERETRFYITSLVLNAIVVAPLIRDHWAIENSLHWILDMAFRDDECRLRIDNAPANFTTIKHIALNLIRMAKSKDSIRLRRKVAAWDDEFLVSLMQAA